MGKHDRKQAESVNQTMDSGANEATEATETTGINETNETNEKGREIDFFHFPTWPGVGPIDAQSLFFEIPKFDIAAINKAAQFNAELVSTFAQLNTETAKFLSHRLAEDSALPSRLAAKREPTEVAQTYSEFFATASEEYTAQMRQTASVFSDLANRMKSVYMQTAKETAESD